MMNKMAGTMPGPGMADNEATESENESPSIFLSKASLGDRKVKPGDTLTLTVSDVDPETGDVQADLAGGGSTTEGGGGYAEAFDKAMPEEA